MISAVFINRDKLFSIFVSAVPGFYRLVAISLVGFLFGIEEAGVFGLVMSLASFVIAVFVDGIFSDLNRFISGSRSVGVVFSYILYPVLCVIFISFLFAVYLFFEVGLGSFFYLIFFAVYMALRKVFVIRREYFYVIKIDCFVLFFYFSVFFYISDPYYSSISFFVGILIFFSRFKGMPKRMLVPISKESYVYSFNSLLSSGVGFLIPVFVYHLYGAEYSGVLSILISYASIFLLLPRAFGQYYLSKMGELKSSEVMLKNTYSAFLKNNFYVLLFMGVFFPLVYFFVIFFDVFDWGSLNVFYLLLALFVYYFLSQLSLPLSCYFIIKGEALAIFKANVAYSLFSVAYLAFEYFFGLRAFGVDGEFLGLLVLYFCLAIFQGFKFIIMCFYSVRLR